jgi:TolB-like protein
MAEEILNALPRLPGLRVATRSSAFQFKERGRDIRKGGEVPGVRTVSAARQRVGSRATAHARASALAPPLM